MLPETRRKLKALVILAMLSVSEGRRVSARISLSGSQSGSSAFNADGGAEEGVHNRPEHARSATNPKVMEQAKLAFEQLNAIVEDPDPQGHLKRFADQITAMLTVPKVQEQAEDALEQWQSIMEDSGLQENVTLFAEKIAALATHPKVFLHAELVVDHLKSIMEDQAFLQHAKLASEQLTAIMEQLQAITEYPGLQQNLELIAEQHEIMTKDPAVEEKPAFWKMEYADLQGNAKLALQQLTSIMEDSGLLEHWKAFEEHVNAMALHPKMKELEKLAEELLADQDVQDHVELASEQLKTIMQDPLLQDKSKLFVERMQALMTDSKVQQHAKLALEQLYAAMEDPILQNNSKAFAELMEAIMTDQQMNSESFAEMLETMMTDPKIGQELPIEAINGEQAAVTKGEASSLTEVSRKFIPPLKKFITRKSIPLHTSSRPRGSTTAGTTDPTWPSMGSDPQQVLDGVGAARSPRPSRRIAAAPIFFKQRGDSAFRGRAGTVRAALPPAPQPKPVAASRQKRIDAFDSIRFFLIAYIVVNHFIIFAKPSPFVHRLFAQSDVVVAAFFALSGYVAAYTGCEVGERKCKDRVTGTPPPAFILSRVFGYWPLHLLLLIIFSPMFAWIDLSYNPFPKGLFTVALNAFLSLTMTQCWFPSKAEIWNAPSWFLGSLTFATMLTPYFLPVIAKQDKKQLRRTTFWIMLFTLLPKLGYVFATDSFGGFEGTMKPSLLRNVIRFNPLFCVFEVMIGVVAARMVMLDKTDGENSGWARQTMGTILPLFGMVAVILLRAAGIVNLSDQLVKPILFVPLFLRFLMGLHRASVADQTSDPLTKVMSLKPLTWLGALSFPIYLVHQPLGQIFYKKAFVAATWKKWFDISFAPSFFYIYLLLVGAAAFLLKKCFMESKKVAEWSKSAQASLLKFL